MNGISQTLSRWLPEAWLRPSAWRAWSESFRAVQPNSGGAGRASLLQGSRGADGDGRISTAITDWETIASDDDSRRIKTTVLVNTRNHGRFIEDCIDSLLVQTVRPNEIIVHDDGSTDDTRERLKRYGNRITLIQSAATARSPHQRQAEAIHAAFRRSSGQLVFLLDGDDRFKRNKLERYLAAFAVNPDTVLIQSPMDKIDEHGRIIGSNLEPRKHVVEHLKAIYREQDVDFFYPTSALAFARPFLLSVLPVDCSDGLALWADTRLSVIAPYFGRVITLPEPYADWRRHTGSNSIRVRARNLQLRQTMMRTKVFNRFCRRHGLRTISAWRNSRFYLQLLRFSLPESAYRMFHRRLRARLARVH